VFATRRPLGRVCGPAWLSVSVHTAGGEPARRTNLGRAGAPLLWGELAGGGRCSGRAGALLAAGLRGALAGGAGADYWGEPGRYWGQLGRNWGELGATGANWGATGASWALLGRAGALLGRAGGYWGELGCYWAAPALCWRALYITVSDLVDEDLGEGFVERPDSVNDGSDVRTRVFDPVFQGQREEAGVFLKGLRDPEVSRRESGGARHVEIPLRTHGQRQRRRQCEGQCEEAGASGEEPNRGSRMLPLFECDFHGG